MIAVGSGIPLGILMATRPRSALSRTVSVGLAALGSWRNPSTPAAVGIPLLVLAYPIFDTTLVVCLRILEGRSPVVGGRDHTTVLHAVRKIGGERQKDTELNQQLHVLEQTLKG